MQIKNKFKVTFCGVLILQKKCPYKVNFLSFVSDFEKKISPTVASLSVNFNIFSPVLEKAYERKVC